MRGAFLVPRVENTCGDREDSDREVRTKGNEENYEDIQRVEPGGRRSSEGRAGLEV